MSVELDQNQQVMSQGRLIWRDFRKHRLAMVGLVVLIIMYGMAIFADFLSPYDPNQRHSSLINLPPQRIHLRDEEGWHGPFVYGINRVRDPQTFEMSFAVNKNQRHPVQFFVRGYSYKLFGLFETDIHLFGVKDGTLFIFGSDHLGRDLFSRILIGTRLSLSIGLIGVFLSLVLGVLIGGISGLIGGTVDNVIQRIIEFLLSLPTIPVWMALASALPGDWSITKVYFAITVILSLTTWTSMARVIRGRVLQLREEDFIMAAEAFGANSWFIIVRHLIPNCMSYILVNATLAIPGMILGETALSFLGLGLRAPAVSWGVLLQNSQNVRALASYPWYFTPVVFVIITVLALNFVGDGLRDASDPYHG